MIQLAEVKLEVSNANKNDHFKKLESMYLAAPINKFYLPEIEVSDKKAKITIKVDPKMYHSAQGVHGSVYFKMLDDAAYFAVNSVETEFFVLTTSFTTKLTKVVTAGSLTAIGEIVEFKDGVWRAKSILYNDDKEVGFGEGVFVKGKTPLVDALGYL